jgi:hypothetical protein
MIPVPLALEKRLQDRYRLLVEQHFGQAKPTAAGPRTLPALTDAFAATQAAWRFWRNQRVTWPGLTQPLLSYAAAAVARECPRYALVVHDWSHFNYAAHTGKRDRRTGDNAGECGYDAHVALVVSDTAGSPLAPVYQGLYAAEGLHDSRQAGVQTPVSNLDGLASVFDFVRDQGWERPAVHLIDREADSVGHFRAWQAAGHLFLVRADTDRLVWHQDQESTLAAVVTRLQQQGAFCFSREVEYHGRTARQEVAETTVVLHRAAFPHRVVDGQKKKRRVPGAPLTLRLVVSRVYSADGALRAEWLLFTNVPMDVLAAEIALWYYWRWRIESYFKLLKSAGQEVEHWQQETAAAIARRLLVAGMACALVWQVARNPTPEAAALRQLLVRLSGRQMAYGVEFTEPALLAGLWVLLALREALAEYSVADLQRLAALALGAAPAPTSGEAVPP